jgi:glucose/arabinose dehydrogenase
MAELISCMHAGAGFPQKYNGSIFVAEHGSWARQTPIGYRVVNVRLWPNSTAAAHEVFAEGWLGRDGKYWGEPDNRLPCAPMQGLRLRQYVGVTPAIVLCPLLVS